MGLLLPALQGKEPSEGAHKRLEPHLAYIADNLTPDALLFGADVTLADIQFSYLLANLSRMGFLENPRASKPTGPRCKLSRATKPRSKKPGQWHPRPEIPRPIEGVTS